jgi:hypothetical protein
MAINDAPDGEEDIADGVETIYDAWATDERVFLF